MQFYSSFSFFCPAGLPQDCPVRRVRICRPFRGKGPSTCSKGKTGACVLTRQRRAEPPESPGPIRHIADSRPQNHAALSEKRRRTCAPHSAHRLRAPAQRSRTRRPLSPREKTCVEARLPCFSPPPHQICGTADRLRLSDGNTKVQRICAQPPRLRFCDSARPQSTARKQRTKKRRCRNTVFFCSTRRGTGENIRARSCRTFRRVPAPRNICCARGRTCTPCPPAADSLPCRPSPSSF